MEEFRFSEWQFDFASLAPKELASSLQVLELRPIVEAYLANVERFLALSLFPSVMFSRGISYERAEVAARMTLLGSPFYPLAAKGVPVMTRMGEVVELQKAYFTGETPCPVVLGAITSPQRVFDVTPSYFRQVFQTLAATQVVGIWTTFETLAADLWEVSLNLRPKLAFSALGAEPSADDDEEEKERKRKRKFALPVWLMEKWDFDIKHRMGTLLKGKWDFANRNGACDAYAQVFGKTSKAEVKALFDNHTLKWLAALRNAIVHNSGRADAEFLQIVESHPELGKITPKTPISLTAQLCKDFTTGACDSSKKLILFVDGWLTANK